MNTSDDENRLTLVSDDSGHTFRTGFIYDGLGRLRARQVYMWYTQYSIWIPTDQWRYLYDGSRVVQERTSDQPPVAYTRGNDLSGSLEGAGGIGGLLARSEAYYGGNWHGHAFYHADGNGNVTSLVGTNLAVVASYKYDPYGRTISSSGSLASANVYRFSSKEIHPESGMYYYLYRFYDPNVQRWLNRDPLLERPDGPFIEERPNGNDYTYCVNAPVSRLDPFGLTTTPGSGRYGDCTKQQYQQMNSAIGKACKDSGKMHCFKTDDCATIKLKIGRFDACIKAREVFNDTCWSGESSIELNEIKNSKRGRENCQKLFCDKSCN